MANSRDAKRSDKARATSIKVRDWLPAPVGQVLDSLAVKFPRAAGWLTALAIVVFVLFMGVQQGPALWKGVSEISAAGTRLSIRADPVQPGRLVCTVENPSERPLLVAGVTVKVLSATPAPFTVAGEMDIPVAGTFSMVLSPTAESRTSVDVERFMIGPRAIENIELRLGSEGEVNRPWIQYEIEITVQAPQSEAIATGKVSVAVPVIRK